MIAGERLLSTKKYEQKEEDFRGFFHEWSIEGGNTVGIVEDETGRVHLIWAASIRFVKEVE